MKMKPATGYPSTTLEERCAPNGLPMKKYSSLILGTITLLAIAGLSYMGATGTMAGVTNYRSPLHNNPPTAGKPLGQPLTRRVVIVLIDALRLDTSFEKTVMPFLNELRSQGAFASMHSRPPSFSEPGYTTLLTGAWPEISDGPAVNLDYADIPTFTQDDLFSAAHRAGLKTAVTGYYWFEKLIPQTAVDASYYTPGEDAAADADVMQAAMPMLLGDYQLVLIHLDQVDFAGHHQGGPLNPNWDAAAEKTDEDVSAIASLLDLNQDTLVVLSDHGQIDSGGHGGPEAVTLLEPFIMAGAAVIPGEYADIQQVDVAPTMAALLGSNIPASSQGTVLTKMLKLGSGSLSGIEAADTAQKQQLYQAYLQAIKPGSTASAEISDPAGFVNYMDDARADRIAGGRLWRIPVAVILGVLPAAVLVWRKSKKTIWLAIGALIYGLLFNFRYAIIDSHTYSLSWIESETSFFLYAAGTTAIALVIAWLVIMGRLGAFKLSPRRYAKTSMGLTFMILYWLLLPVLVSFAVNGLGVGWTLPEFYTIFIALLSFIQSIFVIAFGLLLTGGTALIMSLVRQTRFTAATGGNVFRRGGAGGH
jgi:hypothetical protein